LTAVMWILIGRDHRTNVEPAPVLRAPASGRFSPSLGSPSRRRPVASPSIHLLLGSGAPMRILEKLQSGSPAFSFEFFPPKSSDGVERLFQALSERRPYAPAYVSVTYGAFGTTRNLTVELA